MADSAPPQKPPTIPPLRLDSPAAIRRSLDTSPSQSSLQSSRAHTPSSSVPSTPVFPARPTSPEKKPLHPGDSNAFLTALAAEERRVLELKEELQKAELELERLKKQWATHEATKKRDGLRNLEQLQPLKMTLAWSVVSRDDDPALVGRDPDRRKMAPPRVRPARTVFSGRHTRALSLASPKDSEANCNTLRYGSGASRLHRDIITDPELPSTVHELITSNDGPNDPDASIKSPPKDMILETGKQLVGDFRQGLWTFFEDIRQVTVGEDAASASDPRNQNNSPAENLLRTQAKKDRGSTGKKSAARKRGSLDAQSVARQPRTESSDSKQEADVRPTSVSTQHNNPNNTITASSDSDDDGWDDWDLLTTKAPTSRKKKATSTVDPMSSPLTDKSSPRTSTSSTDKTNKHPVSDEIRDGIPWPAVTTLSPGKLTRTASTLMSAWEKSLAPQANDEAVSTTRSVSKDQKGG